MAFAFSSFGSAPAISARAAGGTQLLVAPLRVLPSRSPGAASTVGAKGSTAPAVGVAVLSAAAVVTSLRPRTFVRTTQIRQRIRRAVIGKKKGTGYGPVAFEQVQKDDMLKDDIAQRVNYVVCENQKGISTQLQQYGYSVIDGFLGGSIQGYPDRIRDQMKKLFDRGWFEEEPEHEAGFKIANYRIQNQDRDHRFKTKLLNSDPGDPEKNRKMELQYEVAPDVVKFCRSLMVSLAPLIGRVAGGKISTNVGIAEMHVLCGQGARFDRRVHNVYGWQTQNGFAPDPRKLTAVYFANPNFRNENGGNLQLEGVITPTGAARIEPVHDRLVLFWSDKSVWSMSPSMATTISDHQYFIMFNLMAEEHNLINYDPKAFARWFPNLHGQPMEWAPPKQQVNTQPNNPF